MDKRLVFFVCALFACSTSRQAPVERLEAAYRAGSVSQLEEFLESWRAAVPISEQGNGSTELEAAVEIFKGLYRPHELQRLGTPEWGPDQYSATSHAVVQGALRYQIVDDAKFPGRLQGASAFSESVEVEFCPHLKIPEMGVLCLSRESKNVLQAFLGDESEASTAESTNRLDFLNKRLKILPGHWGGWYLETHPRVTLIRFNRSMTEAIAYFQVVHQGGEARYRKTSNGWEFQEARFTWIA